MSPSLLFETIGARHGVIDMPCPECSPQRRSPRNRRRPVLRVWRRCEDFLSFSCARCGWQGFGVRDGATRARLTPKPVSSAEQVTDIDRSARALALWGSALPLRGSLAEIYLASRAIRLTEKVYAAGALRFLQSCPFGAERRPAMLALMRDIVTDEPRAIHRTALKSDGTGKAEMPEGRSPKQMLGPAAGCAVKLVEDEAVTLGLAIAEGIENALTALCAGWSPVWAAGCMGTLAKFPVLAGLDAVTIFSDPEPTGIEAAQQCAIRWRDAGREATVVIPPNGDWNDVGRAIRCL